MSLLGLIGLGFGSGGGPAPDYPAETDVRAGVVYADGTMTGNATFPAVGNVRKDVTYGANGTQYTGTLVVPPNPTPPSGVASQGVKPQDLLDCLQTYLELVSGLPTRKVILWCDSGRPNPEGADQIVWYRPAGEDIDKSLGPVRYGNKFTVRIDVTLVSRKMRDGTQRDRFRLPYHYIGRWKMVNSLQNLNLFNGYQTPHTPPDPWYPPQPLGGAYPVTVEPMYLSPVPGEVKDQFEEATISTTFTVALPAVLALSV